MTGNLEDISKQNEIFNLPGLHAAQIGNSQP